MRLRTNLTRPQKLEDEIAYGKSSKDPTKPAFPDLQQSQVVPFNPHLPAAAFPTLSASIDGHGTGDIEASANRAVDGELGSGDDYKMSIGSSTPTNTCYTSQEVPILNSPLDLSFEDQMAASDDEDCSARREQYGQQPCTIRDVDDRHSEPQVMAVDTVHWKGLSPAVQLAIVSKLSDQHPVAKIYDILGLYAQDVGDVKKIAAKYNFQREVEDKLIFWMQQDQLSGILRTDHTLTTRDAAEAYHQFQTRNYMKKMQAEIDESLLQATRAEVDLGKRFLAQRGIQRNMVGFWDHLSGYTQPARHYDYERYKPSQPVLPRSGLDSGYVSSTISADKTPKRNKADLATAARPRPITRARQQTEARETSRPGNDVGLELHQMTAPLKDHQAQGHNSPRIDCCSPDSAEDASAAGSSGRSRRSIRRSSRYDEAIAELKLRGSGGELDSDYEMSDDNDRDSEKTDDCHAATLSPRLRITFNNRIVGVSASSSDSTLTQKASNVEMHKSSNIPRISPLDASGARATTPKRIVSPMPLQRVVVRPPKTMRKPKQSNIAAEAPKDFTKNELNQRLFSVPRVTNDFTKTLLKVSERDNANATPWISPQPANAAESAPSLTVDQRKRSKTVTAPAFSPITEDFPTFSSQEYLQKNTVLQSSFENVRSDRSDWSSDGAFVKSSLPQTPNVPSTPASQAYYSKCNDRPIVTESGSPLPCRMKTATKTLAPAANGVIRNSRSATSMRHEEDSSSTRLAMKTPHPPFSMTNVYCSLDPISGDARIEPFLQQAPPATSPTHKLPPQASSSKNPPKPLIDLEEAGEVQKAAADIKKVATEITRSTVPTQKAVVVAAPNSSAQSSSAQSNSTALDSAPTPAPVPAPVADALKQKRRYVKSEAQRRKETERKERRERGKPDSVVKAKQVVAVAVAAQEPEPVRGLHEKGEATK